MALAEVLIELKTLLVDAEANQSRINQLLEENAALAEFEVARFFVVRKLIPTVEKQLKAVDPRARLSAVRLIPLTFPRAPAARLLRKVVKDADPSVGSAARAAVRKLGLRDVALPDRRFRPGRAPLAPGGWNPSGWWFGLFRNSQPVQQKVDAPAIPSHAALCTLLGVAETELDALMRPGEGAGSPYVEFEVPKRSGGVRRICAPRPKLRAAQRALLDKVLSRLPVHPAAHGFVTGRSTVTNAQPHVDAAVVVKVDLDDFFPSIHYRRVLGLFESYGYRAIAQTLAALTTHRTKLPDGRVAWPGVLPQGAPTSPAIANLVCRRLDSRLTALSKKFGATYTRYADDLTFSFKEAPSKLGRFLWWVNAICQQEGFSENERKRRIMRHSGRQAVTGLVVNERVAIPRTDRRKLKAILHNVQKHGLESQAAKMKLSREAFLMWLEGQVAYVRMVQPKIGEPWMTQVRALRGP